MVQIFSAKESALIDAYWRAANYLSVGQIYLFDNPLLKAPLKQGDKLPVTLQFEKAGTVAVSLNVEGMGAKGPAADSGKMDMKMDGQSGMKKM